MKRAAAGSDHEVVGLQGRADPPDGSDAAARLASLVTIARVVGSARGHQDVLVEAARAARLALGASAVSLSVWERDLGQLRTILNEGELAAWEQDRPHDEVYSVHQVPELAVTLTRGEGCVLSMGRECGPRAHSLLEELDKGSGLNLPVLLEGQVWGTLWVSRGREQPPYRQADLEYGSLVAAQVAAAIASGERIAQVERSAFTDPLTGLANRRALDDRLDRAFDARRAAADDGSRPVVSLVVCGVNGMRLLNDAQGREAGDAAMVRLAGVLSAAAALAPGSLASRLGGDEFCVLLDAHAPDDAVRVAEAVCRESGSVLPHSVSCGVASTGRELGQLESGSRLFRVADAAQVRAKRSRARRPVVSGRSLPGAGAEPLPAVPPTSAAGAVRGAERGDERLGLVAAVVAALDDGTVGDPRGRMAVVAAQVARHVDAAGWWLSVCPVGEPVVRTVDVSMHRGSQASPAVATVQSQVGSEFPLAEYPLTAEAVEGGAFWVAVDDPYADPAEITFLDSTGGIALLVAGGRDRTGTGWLLEIMGDELSRPMRDLAAPCRALVATALAPRR